MHHSASQNACVSNINWLQWLPGMHPGLGCCLLNNFEKTAVLNLMWIKIFIYRQYLIFGEYVQMAMTSFLFIPEYIYLRNLKE